MKNLLTILLILLCCGAMAQAPFTPVEGQNITVTRGGKTYKAFTPIGYNTYPASRIYFHVFFHGDFTSTAGTENQVMGKWIKAGGPWNGKVVMPNGDTVMMVILSIPDYGNDPLAYGDAIKWAIQSWSRLNTDAGGTTPIPGHFSMGGLSGGPGRIYAWQTSDTTKVRSLFKNGVFLSPVFFGGPNNGWTAGGNWFVGWNRLDPNGGTPPSTGPHWYANLLGNKDSMSVAVPGCHCNTVWDAFMSTSGLTTLGGSTPDNNRIRFLIDPLNTYGGGNVNPSANAGADQLVTLPATATLNGSSSFDLDGTIVSYLWEKISGPDEGTIDDPDQAVTGTSDLEAGVYVFRLTVTDDQGGTGSDEVIVTVSEPPPPPGPFPIVGEQRLRLVDGLEVLYFLSDTSVRPTLKHFFVLNAIDSTGKDSAYAAQLGLAKKIAQGWNGLQPLPSGDTAAFHVVTQIDGIREKNDIEKVIQWALDSLPSHVFDTATRWRNIMTGIGEGAQRQLYYLGNQFGALFQGGALKFHENFMTFTPVDISDIGTIPTATWSTMKQPMRSKWIWGSSNGYPYLPAYSIKGVDSMDNRQSYPNTRQLAIAGQNYTSVTKDSAYSTASTNINNNTILWWADSVFIPEIYPEATLITVTPHDVFDMVQGNKTLEKLFDGDESTVGIPNFFEGYIFEEYWLNGIIVDLKRYINHPKVEIRNTNNGGLTVYFRWLYDWTDTTRHSDWFSAVLPGNETGWRWVDTIGSRPYADSSRFMQIRIPDVAANGFSEVRVYGNDLGPAPSIYPAPAPPPPDPGKWAMAYGKLFTDSKMDDYGWTQRQQNDMGYIDTTLKDDYTGRDLVFNRYGNSTDATLKPAKDAGLRQWVYFGNVREKFRYSPLDVQSKDMPIGADSTSPDAWIYVQRTMYAIAAKFGFNESADFTGYTMTPTDAGVGQGYYRELEVGNEDMQHWNGSRKFHSPEVQLEKVKAGSIGMKLADPGMESILGAMTGLRNDRIKALYMTNLLKYKTKILPWDNWAINEYATNAGGQHAGSNVDGVSPEQFRTYEKVDSTRRLIQKVHPGAKFYITEWGYDTHNSNYNVPDIAGQTRRQTQAFWTWRSRHLIMAAKADRFTQYTQRDIPGGDFGTTGFSIDTFLADPGNELPEYLHQFMSAGVLENGGWTSLPKDSYWWGTMDRYRLQNYKAHPEIILKGDSTGTWVLKYTHQSDPDSIIYAVWHGTHSNSSASNLQISVPNAASAVIVTPVVGVKLGTETEATIDGSNVIVPSVVESGNLIIVKLGEVVSNERDFFIRKGRRAVFRQNP